jgi:glycosyltransferase involved in cell wall biosynthesis
MKKILIFSLAYYPRVGGAEVALKEITDRLPDIEFHMVTMRFSAVDATEEKLGNVFVHRVGGGASYPSKILFIPRAMRRAIQLNNEQRFDALWAMMSYMLFPIVLLRLAGTKIPYALTLQEGDPFEHVFSRWYIKLFSPLLSYGFRHADVVQAISTFLGGWARAAGFRGPLAIIPNGVDIRKFTGEKIPHDGTVLITASRLVKKNAVDDIIRALALLPESISFLVLGTGPDEAMLKKLAHELGVQDRTRFLGYVDQKEIQKYLKVSDIFIRPSRSEGMGNSFIEAFAAGLPVVATQEGGIADFLFDAKRNPEKSTTGWAVDKNNPEQIALAVQDIISNPEEVRRVVDTARALAVEKYDWDLIAKAICEKVFGKMLKND